MILSVIGLSRVKMGEPGHFYKQCTLEPDFDQYEFSEGLDHQRVIPLGGVWRHPAISNPIWQSKSC